MPPDQDSSLTEPLLSHENERNIDEVPPLVQSSTSSDPTSSSSNDSQPTIQKDVIFPAWLCFGRRRTMNHNVFLNLLLCVFYGLSESLWNGTANAAYLKKLGHDRNGPLGNIEAVSGLASLVTALPVGYLADRFGRSRIITAGAWLMLVTTFMQLGLLDWVGTDETEDELYLDEFENGLTAAAMPHRTAALWGYGVVMAFWGVCDGVVNGPAAALYADSTAEGERSAYYTYLFACYIGASSVGPIVSIILFQTLGDVWDLYHLRIVLYVGLLIGMVNIPLMMLFDDKKALEDRTTNEDDAVETTQEQADSSSEQNNAGEAQDCQAETNPADAEVQALLETATTMTSAEDAAPTSLTERQKWIPYIIFFQALVLAIGSGMTVKFFPLFFKDEVGMSPSQVQVIYVCVPVVMIISSTLCSTLAKCIGRVQATLVFSVCGVSCLYSMVFFKSYLDTHPFLLVPIYVIRTSLMNGSYPLQESILMDFVPKEERARWKSLDSVAAFGWCGSAAFGGWLSDKYDYTYTFLITAIVQSAGILIFSLLLPLVPRKEGSRHHENEAEETLTPEVAEATTTVTQSSDD